MTPEADPSIWQQISGWLWGVLVVPLKMLWSKADNAASKSDLADAIRESRETMKTLFANAEEDRAASNERFAAVQDKIHTIHVELLNKIK